MGVDVERNENERQTKWERMLDRTTTNVEWNKDERRTKWGWTLDGMA